jgi:UDP-glucose 4-epimerase
LEKRISTEERDTVAHRVNRGRGRHRMAILITGGAGYIGSVAASVLHGQHEPIVVLDNLSRGHREAVSRDIPFYQGDIGDRELVGSIVREHQIDACMHFAALAYVGESVAEPSRYFENNVVAGISLLNALLENGVRHFVFSSTCATYGEPASIPISESAAQQPVNPYGWSKLIIERALASYDSAYGFRFVALRYFNAAGASRDLGEHHEPETHLIPNVLAAAAGRAAQVEIYGTDYPTVDGTAVRDYIHIEDLADAHVLALRHLRAGGESDFINLGNGQGFSVLEVVDAARRVTGRPITVVDQPRRAGDPPVLVAQAERAAQVLGWQPKRPGLEDIIGSAWTWRLSHPNGYE